MKKVKIIEVYVDEKLDDFNESLEDIISSIWNHSLIDDGSVQLKVFDVENKDINHTNKYKEELKKMTKEDFLYLEELLEEN